MTYLVIKGGRKLSGELVTQSAKNSAVALLCASLMIKGKTTLTDMPIIEEVERILRLLQSIGVKIDKIAEHTIKLDTSGDLRLDDIDHTACEQTRSSLLLLGALAYREQKMYKLYKSGGCKLGNRTVRPHLLGLQKLGIEIASTEHYYKVVNNPLKAADIVMYESGDTPTENVIMAAVFASGTTTIKMASANYMVQDLCFFLVKAGAKIKGIGTTTLTITGVKKLRPVKEYPIMPDPIIAMTFIAIAITTKSSLIIQNCPLDFLELELLKLEVMGQKFKLRNKRKSKNGKFVIVDIKIVPGYLKALPDKLECRPFPGLNIDNLPLFVPILTQAHGRTLVHDWVYENRAIYFSELKKLGAHIDPVDIHRVWVDGPTVFHANKVEAPPALRPAVALFVCMLAAKGTSILHNPYQIDRGYEHFYEVLNQVGADIAVVVT